WFESNPAHFPESTSAAPRVIRADLGAPLARAHGATPKGDPMVSGLYGVRYQVKDVARSIDFYTRQLGFKLDRKHLPAFAQVSLGDFRLTLSGPGASGSRPMPDGQAQEPGGWNRVMLQVTDLPDAVAVLKEAGAHF